MKIYIVSCSPPRVERLMKAASPLNLDFEVVDSPLGTDEEVIRRGRRCLERGSGYATGIAATIGHVRAMKRIVDRDDPLAIIVEDDVRFHKNFNNYIEMCLDYMKNNPCDIFSIGFVNFPKIQNGVRFKELLIRENVGLGNPWGAQGYIITKKYAYYFSKLFSGDDLSLLYSGKFVTDCVIFDPIINCRRSTVSHPLLVECPEEQTLAGNTNKPPLFKTVRREWFHM